MKTIYQLGLAILLVYAMPNTYAIMAVPADGEPEVVDEVTTHFGLVGKVTRYLPGKKILVIDNVRYQLGKLAKPDALVLKPGLRIRYNLEVSTRPGKKLITRIWVDQENRK